MLLAVNTVKGDCFDPSLVSQKVRGSIVSKTSIVCLFRSCCQ